MLVEGQVEANAALADAAAAVAAAANREAALRPGTGLSTASKMDAAVTMAGNEVLSLLQP